MNVTSDYQLKRTPFGLLEFIDAEGRTHHGVVPVRAFPISSPDQGIALVDPHGYELLWIERLSDLPDELNALIAEELGNHEFMPIISRIVSVSSFATPSTWEVQTNHGDTRLVLNSEEDIRRLAGAALLIADSHGIHYLIPDRYTLDLTSKKILDRFL